ncbi:DNA polymerase delta subunit 3 isoform X1 [Mobula birostris]|uniref:DNA polymerase delta subunit 3 isoform X1 n=1 Tax=Mobula birostris TaxID=1983395 RepID=UPI003B286267
MVAMEELELSMENVEELVMDENRIVTYKMLSHSLGIHVNQAKQLLYYYVERKRKENSGAQLHVTYLVSGKAEEDGISYHKVAVVREDQLEAVKLKLLVTASVHVYSIQRAMLKDSSPLFSTDYETVKENLLSSNKYSAIQCADAVPRSAGEMAQLQKSLQQPSRSSAEPPNNKPIMNGSPPVPSKSAAPQPKGIMAMFSAKPPAKPSDREEKVEPVAVKDRENSPPSGGKIANKGNSFSHFFQKAISKKGSPPAKAIKEEASTSEYREKAETAQDGECHVIASQGVNDEEMAPTSDTAAQKAQAKAQAGSVRAKKVGEGGDGQSSKKTKRSVTPAGDGEEPHHKRRRRIRQPLSDSSDEEVILDSPEPCDMKTPSPTPETPIAEEDISPPCFSEASVKPPSWESTEETEKAVGVKRRKRHRVLKSKTFVNEDGDFVTEKVYQSESCTDSENESTAKPQVQKPPDAKSVEGIKDERKGPKEKKAAAPSRAGKQASIMGFFKKAA